MKVQLSAGNDWQGWLGRIHDQYLHLRKIQRKPPADSSMRPIGKDQLSQLIKFAFWASLKSDEGRTTRVCITTQTPLTCSVVRPSSRIRSRATGTQLPS